MYSKYSIHNMLINLSICCDKIDIITTYYVFRDKKKEEK